MKSTLIFTAAAVLMLMALHEPATNANRPGLTVDVDPGPSAVCVIRGECTEIDVRSNAWKEGHK